MARGLAIPTKPKEEGRNFFLFEGGRTTPICPKASFLFYFFQFFFEVFSIFF
jgi:hypothetical protein